MQHFGGRPYADQLRAGKPQIVFDRKKIESKIGFKEEMLEHSLIVHAFRLAGLVEGAFVVRKPAVEKVAHALGILVRNKSGI